MPEAVAAAQTALPGWSRRGILARGEILFRAADLLTARADEIAHDLTREEGKTFAEAKGETLRAAAIFHYYVGEARQEVGDLYEASDPATLLYTRREPVGVVGVITQWNFPMVMPAWNGVSSPPNRDIVLAVLKLLDHIGPVARTRND